MQDTRWYKLGHQLNCFMNVLLLNGECNQTISRRTATAEQNGERWACWGCKFLHYVVEKDHCAKALDPIPHSHLATVRAGVALLIAVFLLHWLYIEIIKLPFLLI